MRVDNFNVDILFNHSISTPLPWTIKFGDRKVSICWYVEYVPRKHLHLVDLPKNHLAKIKSVKFAFTDYKVYEKLSCLPYERMIIQCANQYGALFHLENAECRDIARFFGQCVQLYNVFSHMKKIRPESFA